MTSNVSRQHGFPNPPVHDPLIDRLVADAPSARACVPADLPDRICSALDGARQSQDVRSPRRLVLPLGVVAACLALVFGLLLHLQGRSQQPTISASRALSMSFGTLPKTAELAAAATAPINRLFADRSLTESPSTNLTLPPASGTKRSPNSDGSPLPASPLRGSF